MWHRADGRAQVLDGRAHVLDGRAHVLDGRAHVLDGRAHVLDDRAHVPGKRAGVIAAADRPPSVALLFLPRGPLPHEPTWRLFFEAALQLSPGVHMNPLLQMGMAYAKGCLIPQA